MFVATSWENLNTNNSSETVSTTPFPTYAPKWNVDPEELIEISHGGGLDYITRFFYGKEVGYKIHDVPGCGLFVSVKNNRRDNLYAIEACESSFDIPAKFTAKIKAKYLFAVKNGYEAALFPEFAEYLKDVKISEVPN